MQIASFLPMTCYKQVPTTIAGRHGRGYKEEQGHNGEQIKVEDEDEHDARPAGRSGVQHPHGSATDLDAALRRLEGKSYKAYHDVEGAWACPGYTFVLDRAQSDPFAAPSRCRVLVGSLHDAPPHRQRPDKQRSALQSVPIPFKSGL